MSELQRAWAKSKLGMSNEPLHEFEEEQETDQVPELPDGIDDDSSSASSVSSTGTVIPSPNQKLFARPLGYCLIHPVRTGLTLMRFPERLGAGPWSKYPGRRTSTESCTSSPRTAPASHITLT